MMLNGNKKYLYILTLVILRQLLIWYFTDISYVGATILFDFVFNIVIVIIVWEGSYYIDRKLESKIPLISNNVKRIGIQFKLGGIYTILVTFIFAKLLNLYYYQFPSESQKEFIIFSIFITSVGFLIVFIIEIADQYFMQMRTSIIEVEKTQLQNLKNQVNPHFLFNNLSVLSSLVYSNQDSAVNFIHQLSKVYRYLLDNRSFSMVSLDKELDFIHSYTYLLKIRFDEKIIINFDISPESRNLLIPPMALQILVENAIKHNEISSEKKLTITITSNKKELEISNNLQLRINTQPSSKTGLQNIKDRYAFFTDREIVILENERSFVVKIPLIEDNDSVIGRQTARDISQNFAFRPPKKTRLKLYRKNYFSYLRDKIETLKK